jgi:hypothetical protein
MMRKSGTTKEYCHTSMCPSVKRISCVPMKEYRYSGTSTVYRHHPAAVDHCLPSGTWRNMSAGREVPWYARSRPNDTRTVIHKAARTQILVSAPHSAVYRSPC